MKCEGCGEDHHYQEISELVTRIGGVLRRDLRRAKLGDLEYLPPQGKGPM